MNKAIEFIFCETILMERKCTKLYRLLSKCFTEDEGFWSELADEEEYHAMHIQSAQCFYCKDVFFPIEAFDILNIRNLNKELSEIISQYEHRLPIKQDAFINALKLEKLSGECYFQISINRPDKNPAIELFRSLVDEEVDHAQRIEIKMKMPLQPTLTVLKAP